MRISFSPVRSDAVLSVFKQGDALTINGVVYDFAQLTEGGTLPADAVGCEWLASDVTRVGTEITLTLLLPHAVDASEAVRFPKPITVYANGAVTLPGA